ncbi:MAG: hypothetical protein Q9187_000476 [Circinaria calcarea]
MLVDMSHSKLLQIATGLFLALVLLPTLRYLYRYLTLRLKKRDLIAQYHCLPPPFYPHLDPVFGLDGVRDAFAALKSKTYLTRIHHLYETLGPTFSSRFFLTPVVNTIEPENIKTVLATKFEDYSIGSRRKNAFEPLLGHGIIQVDGARWEHSRALIKPSFTRSQVGDLSTFRVHVDHLIEALPIDGVVVDLGELFFRLSADIATEFLFGESILSLIHPDAMEADFVKAFHEAQIGIEKRWQMGGLAKFAYMPDFHRNVDKVHGFIDRHVEKAIAFQNLRTKEEEQRSEGAGTEKDGKRIFLHELAQATSDRRVLRDELLTMFGGGPDITAALLSNLFFVLARRPRIWTRLRDEVEILGG